MAEHLKLFLTFKHWLHEGGMYFLLIMVIASFILLMLSTVVPVRVSSKIRLKEKEMSKKKEANFVASIVLFIVSGVVAFFVFVPVDGTGKYDLTAIAVFATICTCYFVSSLVLYKWSDEIITKKKEELKQELSGSPAIKSQKAIKEIEKERAMYGTTIGN